VGLRPPELRRRVLPQGRRLLLRRRGVAPTGSVIATRLADGTRLLIGPVLLSCGFWQPDRLAQRPARRWTTGPCSRWSHPDWCRAPAAIVTDDLDQAQRDASVLR